VKSEDEKVCDEIYFCLHFRFSSSSRGKVRRQFIIMIAIRKAVYSDNKVVIRNCAINVLKKLLALYGFHSFYYAFIVGSNTLVCSQS
jgi:hypothetical protein